MDWINWDGFSLFWNGFVEAITLLSSGTVDIWFVIWTSLKVSSGALLISLAVGVPLGFFLGSRYTLPRKAVLVLANAGMGLPPTVVGLFVSMLLSRRGPLGPLDLLYTQPAMLIAQVIISMPLVIAITASAVSAVPAELRLQARSLGASKVQEMILTLKESRMGIFSAIAAGLGSIISEVGAVQMVGGNLLGETQVMTTAIVQYTRMGNYGQAIALALILLLIIVVMNVGLTGFQTSSTRHTKEAG